MAVAWTIPSLNHNSNSFFVKRFKKMVKHKLNLKERIVLDIETLR
ncbi:MAG: hypothetical protein ACI9FU_001284 [Granulosicoccus sp.]|jgi:hypothetical protein